MSAPPTKFAVRVESVAKVVSGVRRSINDRLHDLWRARLADCPRHNATSRTIYDSDDVSLRFFEPMKVNSSSISKVSGFSMGTPASGRLA